MRAYFFFASSMRFERCRGDRSDGNFMHLVDDAQILRVVQQAALGRHFGIDAPPERDVRLELGRTHEMLDVSAGGDRRGERKRRQQGNE